MVRRRTRNITGIRGSGTVDATGVWRVLECTNPVCDCLMKVSEDLEGFPNITMACPKCGQDIGRE